MNKKTTFLILSCLSLLLGSCADVNSSQSVNSGLPSISSSLVNDTSTTTSSTEPKEEATIKLEATHGTASFSKDVVFAGDEIEIYPEADDGYELSAILVNGKTPVRTGYNSYSFTAVAGENIVSLTFTSIPENYDLPLNSDHRIYTINKQNGIPTLDSIGEQKILVIPVSFTDYESLATEEVRQDIETTFFGESADTGWESVASYYEKSSYGKLHLSGTVSEFYDAGIATSSLKSHEILDMDDGGTWWLLDNAVSWYKETHDDISEYDVDKDGYIDAVWMVFAAPNTHSSSAPDQMSNTFWPFSYFNSDNLGEGNVSDPVAYRYSFASYDFMHAGTGYADKVDAHTYIHETGHLLGLIDYYDPMGELHPFGTVDMMDYNIGDHCAYSKFALGWKSPKVITKTTEKITLQSTTETGEFLLLEPEGYNQTPFDEYFLIEFITPTGLNEKDYTDGYYTEVNGNVPGYTKPGIRISHVNSVAVNENNQVVNDIADMKTIPFANTNDLYNKGTSGRSFLLNTIMQKNYSDTNSVVDETVFGIGYTFSEEQLFYTGDTFSLGAGSNYNGLMPNASDILDFGSYFNYSIVVDNITADEATLAIYTY